MKLSTLTKQQSTHLDELLMCMQRYQDLWQSSPLRDYRRFDRSCPTVWLNELSRLSDAELLDFELGNQTHLYPHVASELSALQKVWQHVPAQPAPDERLDLIAKGIKRKKLYELACLLSYLRPNLDSKQLAVGPSVIDWGGGKGHLSECLHANFGLPVVCIDRHIDPSLTHRPPSGVVYYQEEVSNVDSLSSGLQSQLAHAHISLGLHACGDLSLHQLAAARQTAANCRLLVNVACCFDKIEGAYQPQSRWGQIMLPAINEASLDLATRTRRRPDPDTFYLKKTVNAFRWCIFLFEQNRSYPTTVKIGRRADRIYRQGFSAYLQSLQHSHPHLYRRRKELQSFFDREETQQQLNRIFLLHLIRSRFARAVEFLVVFDRASWMLEAGFEVELLQLFDVSRSPRNLALIAYPR